MEGGLNFLVGFTESRKIECKEVLQYELSSCYGVVVTWRRLVQSCVIGLFLLRLEFV